MMMKNNINLNIGGSTSNGSSNNRPAPLVAAAAAAAYGCCLSRTVNWRRANFSNNGAAKLYTIKTTARRRSMNTKKNATGSDEAAITTARRRSMNTKKKSFGSEETAEVAASYIPIYVMLPLGFIDKTGQLADEEGLKQKLKILKLINVDGVVVECFWGIVESHSPKNYEWKTYKNLFELVKKLELKLQVLMSFHGCSGNMDDEVSISLPQWVLDALSFSKTLCSSSN